MIFVGDSYCIIYIIIFIGLIGALNIAKCNTSFASKINTIHFHYILRNTVIRRSEIFQNLGIDFIPKFTFVPHI